LVRTVRTPTVDDIAAAAVVVAQHLSPTPVVRAPALGAGVVLKLETMQPTGSFKVRGALAAVAKAVERDASQHLVTASAGNHGLGVAYAATAFAATATVVVPENASAAKVAALSKYAVTLVAKGASYDEAEAYALTLADDGSRFVSPYNDPDTIAGQGSIALELFDQVEELRTIVVPIGGGGLISGVALAATMRPGVRVVGVEAGSVTVDLVRRYVDDIVSVSEDEIIDAIRFLVREHGFVVEGSGAVGVAALRNGHIDVDASSGSGSTAVLLTGRNIAASTLVRLLAEGT